MTDPRTLSDYQELFRRGNAHTKMCWGEDCPRVFGPIIHTPVYCDCPHHDLPPSPRAQPPETVRAAHKPAADKGLSPGTILSADPIPPPMPPASPGASFSDELEAAARAKQGNGHKCGDTGWILGCCATCLKPHPAYANPPKDTGGRA